MKYWAKSLPLQTVEEHTLQALNVYYNIKKKHPHILSEEDWNILKIAVIYHDFGKLDPEFQNRIRKAMHMPLLEHGGDEGEYFYHNYLSPAFLDPDYYEEKFGEEGFDILVKAIYFHHNRKELSQFDRKKMDSYIMKVLDQGTYNLKIEDIISIKSLSNDYTTYAWNFNTLSSEDIDNELINRYILVKGMLNRIDHAASAGIDQIEEDILDDDLKHVGQKTEAMILNKGYQLRTVQSFMKGHSEKNLIVVASTGTGKTEAALLWIGENKAFYTLPLKVSINDIYNRIIQKVGYKKTALLHSEAFSFYLSEYTGDDALEQYSLSRLLAKPLTLCTIDQLFKFTYKYNGGEIPLATLSYSKLIIDEIQMYSPLLVGVLIYGLKCIIQLGGKFSIITATFPYLLYNLMDQEGIPYEASCKSKVFHGPITKRHLINLLNEKEFNYNFLTEAAKSKKVLVICNTVTRAQQVYETLSKMTVDVKLLHSAFIKKDRRSLECEIIKFASNSEKRNDQSGIWVTTQIVEASLDIDFDILFTEMTTVDSLLQRMGRVYRGRWYDLGGKPNVYIMNNWNTGGGMVVDHELYEYSLKAVKQFDGVLLEESDEVDYKQQMINQVYHPDCNLDIVKSKYYRSIKDTICNLTKLDMYDLTKDKVDRIFRDIDSITIMPKAIYQKLDVEKKLQQWKAILENKKAPLIERQKIKDEIAEYTVSLSNYHNLDIDLTRQLIYDGSRIYLYLGDYDYNDKGVGKGIIKKYKKPSKQKSDIFI